MRRPLKIGFANSNGRRTTCVVIEPASDAWVNDDGTLDTIYIEEPLPGVSHTVVTDATGNTTTHGRDSATATPTPGPYMASQNFEVGIWRTDMVSIILGVGRGPDGPHPDMITTFTGTGSGSSSTDTQSSVSYNCAQRKCACDGENPSEDQVAVTRDDPATGFKHDMVGGNVRDWPPGIMFNGPVPGLSSAGGSQQLLSDKKEKLKPTVAAGEMGEKGWIDNSSIALEAFSKTPK